MANQTELLNVSDEMKCIFFGSRRVGVHAVKQQYTLCTPAYRRQMEKCVISICLFVGE